MHKPITTVLFDLGGTLFEHLPPARTEANLHRAHAELALGGDVQAARYHAIRAEVEQQFADVKFFRHRELVAESFGRYAKALGHGGSDAERSRVIAGFCDAQRGTVVQNLAPRADLDHAVEALRQAGLTLGIVSNIDNDVLDPLVSRWQLDRWAQLILSSETARSCKPHPAIFTLALDTLDATPSQTLFVGDSLANDVLGAAALGMRTAFLNPPELKRPIPGRAQTAAHYVVDGLSELASAVVANLEHSSH